MLEQSGVLARIARKRSFSSTAEHTDNLSALVTQVAFPNRSATPKRSVS